MFSCQESTRDNDALYDAVATSRGPSTLAALQHWAPYVKGSYRQYTTLIGTTGPRVSIVSDPGSSDGDLLRGNWSELSKAAFAESRNAALIASFGTCCLCGYATAGEVDHYLPKSLFPEYSIYTSNLIASCGRCNRKKASRFQRAGGGPAFVHPYRHHLPDEQFLTCSVELEASVILRFDVAATPGMDAASFAALRNQFVTLDLGAAYLNEAVGTMGEQLGIYYAYYRADGAEGVSRYLEREARSSSAWYRSRGFRNHWKPTLLFALARHPGFCDGGFMLLGPEFPLD